MLWKSMTLWKGADQPLLSSLLYRFTIGTLFHREKITVRIELREYDSIHRQTYRRALWVPLKEYRSLVLIPVY